GLPAEVGRGGRPRGAARCRLLGGDAAISSITRPHSVCSPTGTGKAHPLRCVAIIHRQTQTITRRFAVETIARQRAAITPQARRAPPSAGGAVLLWAAPS